MAIINTGAVERTITGVNESDLFLDESSSTATNTGAVERTLVDSHDANFVHPLSDELIVNGQFDTDSDWVKGTGWSISDGLAASSGSGLSIVQSFNVEEGENYRISFEVKNYQSGKVKPQLGGGTTAQGTFVESNGVYTEYLTALQGNFRLNFKAQGSDVFTGSIDNVSVKKVLVNRESTVTNTGAVERGVTGVNESNSVFQFLGDELVTNGNFDSDSDWNKFGSWDISEGVASFDSSLSGASNLIQDIDELELGKRYRLDFDVIDSSVANFLYKLGGSSFSTLTQVQPNTTNSVEFTFSSEPKKLFLRASSSFTGSIDNVSLKEVLVSRESTVNNTGAVERDIEGVNESDTF